MTSHNVRQKFLAYFEKHGHTVVPSSSLVPDNDPSVLLTTAGMQQFKPFFLGEESVIERFGNTALTSCQKCFRTSDIDEVGDESHHTFFEMLGNFSVADVDGKKKNYFKAETITLAWEFLTQEMKLDPAKLWITIFSGDSDVPADTDAQTLWQAYVPPERIHAFDRETNWWGPPGKTGACGPSSEIHVDRTGIACERGVQCLPNCSCGRFLELWNLVFTEYEKNSQGEFRKLKHAQIDTGMGLERLLAVLEDVPDNFDTDLFRPIMHAIDKGEFVDRNDTQAARRRRIIADHVRGAVFLLADGVTFSNKEQGYILRRIVRRALDQCAVGKTDLEPVASAVVNHYHHVYPSLQEHEPAIITALHEEAAAYQHVLETEVAAVVAKVRRHRRDANTLPGVSETELTPQEAVQLYTTYGLSIERMKAEGFTFDDAAFQELLEAHKMTSRQGSEQKFGGHGLHGEFSVEGRSTDDIWNITRLHTATHILHQALRRVLGDDVHQAGSDITPERLRFDFNFARKLTPEEREAVEKTANKVVEQDLPVTFQAMTLPEALKTGALSFFREKYPDEVTVYSIGDFSKELCGGPHVQHTKQVGPIKILSEKSSAAGVRRLKAVVGVAA